MLPESRDGGGDRMTTITAPVARTAPTRGRRVRPALLLGGVGAVVGFLGSWIPSYWGDEAASVMSATRSWPSLAAELSTIDGVHGLYYAFLKLWVGLFGTSELATRLPSALAAGVMVAGIVVLVRQFGDARLAVLAGIVAIAIPRTTFMAAEARSYAMGAAAAVWLTVLLVTLVRRRASTGPWIVYGIAVACSAYLFLYLLLLLAVHAAYVVFSHREALRGWAVGAVAAVILAVPIFLIGYDQREQIDFLARRNYATIDNVLANQWFSSPLVAVFGWAAVLVVVVRMLRRRRATPLTVLALAWLVLPSAALLLGNALIAPMYNVRYLSFSTPAAAIAIALGIAVVARSVRSSRARLRIAVALTVVFVALCVPVYLSQRTPWAKDGGSDWRQVADYVQANARAGDAIIFDQATKPSRDPRLALNLYPAGFAAVRDVALITPYDETDGLWDVVAPNTDTIRLTGVRDVWAVELLTGAGVPADVARLEMIGYRVTSTALIHRTTVYHLVKE